MKNKIVLRTKCSTSKGKKVMGAYLPLLLSQYVHLHSIAHEKSISVLVEQALDAWVIAQHTSLEKLKGLVKNRVLNAYKTINEAKAKVEFAKGLEAQLTSKGIDEEIINELLNAIGYAKNKANNRKG